MTDHADTIMTCLELVAAKCDDLAPDVYQRFFALYPDGDALFGIDTGDNVKGRMIMSLLDELIRLSANEVYAENIKRWVHDHRGYGVTQPMYQAMFDCFLASIEANLGDDWTPQMDTAWRAQYQRLTEYVDYIYQS